MEFFEKIIVNELISVGMFFLFPCNIEKLHEQNNTYCIFGLSKAWGNLVLPNVF